MDCQIHPSRPGRSLRRRRAHFETLWNDPEFQRFDPRDEIQRGGLRRALQQAKGTSIEPIATPTWFDLQPKATSRPCSTVSPASAAAVARAISSSPPPAQAKPLLRHLTTSASANNRAEKPRLLFVAHRVEILCQAIDTYRQVLRASLRRAPGRRPPARQQRHLFCNHHVGHRAKAAQPATAPTTGIPSSSTNATTFRQASSTPFTGAIRLRVLLGLAATPGADGRPRGDAYFDAPDGVRRSNCAVGCARPATARTSSISASTDNTDLGSVLEPAWRTGTARQGHQRQRRTRPPGDPY